VAGTVTTACVYVLGAAALGETVTVAWLSQIEPSDRYPRLSDFLLHYWPAAERAAQRLPPTEGFQYPPLALVTFLPLATAASRELASSVWVGVLALSAGAIAAAPLPVTTRDSRWRFLAAVLVLSSSATWHCVRWGQISLPVTALALWGATNPSTRWGPWLLSASIGLKLYPAILLGVLLPWVRGRVAWYLFALVIMTCGVPVAVLGPGYSLQWAEAALRTLASETSSWMPLNSNAQFVSDVLTRPFGGTGRSVAVFAAVVASLWSALHAVRAAMAGERWLAVAATWLLVPLLVPPAWPHYFVFLPWVLVVLISADAPSRPWHHAVWGVSAVVTSMLGPILVGGWPMFAHSGVLALCSLLLLAVTISRIRQVLSTRKVESDQPQHHGHQ
jgi:hypothetical protein